MPLLLLFFLTLTPLKANAQLGIEILDVRPLKDDAFVYMTVAGTSQGEPSQGRLAVDYYLRNNGSTTRRIHHVTLDFDNPNIASIVMRDELAMWCPWPRPNVNPPIPVMTVQTGLDIAPGSRCRLGLLDDPHFSLPAATRLRITIFFEIGSFQIGVSDIERDLVNHTHPTPTGSYRFPFKQSDMPPGTFASGRSPASFGSHRFGNNPQQVHSYDMGLGRWAADENRWVSYFPLPSGQTAPLLNEEFLHWGLPVYAMADGTVVACSSGNVDDTPTFEPNVPSNSFTIQHGDELAQYVHLRFGSIDQSICFAGATVSEGQFLGEVGNSGDSSVPHLHIQVTRNGEAMPLQFNETFVIDRNVNLNDILAGDNMPWARIDGYGLPKEETVLWSSGLRRRGEVATGIPSVQNVLTKSSASRTVTASRMPSGDLQTLLWRTDLSGDVAALDVDLGGAVQDLSLATPNSTQDAALAVITGGGSLKLIAYDVAGNTLSRTAEHTSGPAQAVVASTAPFNDGIMTAVRTQFGNFKLIAWQVDPQAGIINRRADADGGAVQTFSMTNTSAFEGVAVAAVTGSGRLKLLTFAVPLGGFSVQREDDFLEDDVDDVSITQLGVLPNGEDLVVTASRTATGSLELISWSIDWQGNITRLDDAQAGAIGEVKAARIDAEYVLTTVTDSAGDLKFVAWHVASDGTITRSADLAAGAATAIAQSDAVQTTPSLSVTALSDSNGELKVLQVENNLSN